MNPPVSPPRHLRAILDGCLILLLILLLTVQGRPTLAETGQLPTVSGAPAPGVALPAQGFADLSPVPHSVQASTTTLAAMIAAENAALGLPQYFVDLPVIYR